jgi:hypothetical protein
MTDKFKAWIHETLDQAGVPVDPAPARTEITGCRIEGRIHHMLLKMHDSSCAPAPCKFCGVLIAWSYTGFMGRFVDYEGGRIDQHVCKISNLAQFRALTKKKES